MSGVRSGVNGTPTFFIHGTRYEGPWDEASLLGGEAPSASADGAFRCAAPAYRACLLMGIS